MLPGSASQAPQVCCRPSLHIAPAVAELVYIVALRLALFCIRAALGFVAVVFWHATIAVFLAHLHEAVSGTHG